MTKKDQLLSWLKTKHYVTSHEISEWGNRFYHIRALRDCREFACQGLLRRISEDEKGLLGFRCKDGVYHVK